MKKNKPTYYQFLAEQWFDEHYKSMGLWEMIRMWYYDIDPRKSVLSMFGRYLGDLKGE